MQALGHGRATQRGGLVHLAGPGFRNTCCPVLAPLVSMKPVPIIGGRSTSIRMPMSVSADRRGSEAHAKRDRAATQRRDCTFAWRSPSRSDLRGRSPRTSAWNTTSAERLVRTAELAHLRPRWAMTKSRTVGLAGMVLTAGALCASDANAQPITINPQAMPSIAAVDERFQSYNVEMAEVIGAKFWKPYAELGKLAKSSEAVAGSPKKALPIGSGFGPIRRAAADRSQEFAIAKARRRSWPRLHARERKLGELRVLRSIG